ncbi:hypothetical protein GEMRC1_009598 [Eukaryota sp. GEM-RC1]
MTEPKHTLLLIQGTKSVNTRTYIDFPSVSEALHGLCLYYEEELKKSNPGVRNIRYTVQEVCHWVAGLGDIVCMVWEPKLAAYKPHDRQYVINALRTRIGP